jgi:hypothetical protein
MKPRLERPLRIGSCEIAPAAIDWIADRGDPQPPHGHHYLVLPPRAEICVATGEDGHYYGQVLRAWDEGPAVLAWARARPGRFWEAGTHFINADAITMVCRRTNHGPGTIVVHFRTYSEIVLEGDACAAFLARWDAAATADARKEPP